MDHLTINKHKTYNILALYYKNLILINSLEIKLDKDEKSPLLFYKKIFELENNSYILF